MKKLLTATIIGLISCNTVAQTYVGSSMSNVSIKMDELDLNPKMASIHFGKVVNNNLILEGRASTGISSDTEYYGDLAVSTEIDNAVSVHAKFSPDFSNTVAAYATVGYAYAEATAKAEDALPFVGEYLGSYEVSDDESDVVFGLGININADEKVSAFVELTEFSDTDILTFGINVKY